MLVDEIAELCHSEEPFNFAQDGLRDEESPSTSLEPVFIVDGVVVGVKLSAAHWLLYQRRACSFT
ncbi:MAG: hypothetical protein ACE5LU_07335 [Anaerolineae bacterium]